MKLDSPSESVGSQRAPAAGAGGAAGSGGRLQQHGLSRRRPWRARSRV